MLLQAACFWFQSELLSIVKQHSALVPAAHCDCNCMGMQPADRRYMMLCLWLAREGTGLAFSKSLLLYLIEVNHKIHTTMNKAVADFATLCLCSLQTGGMYCCTCGWQGREEGWSPASPS